MESIKQALGDGVIVSLRRAVERGDHHSIDGSLALSHFERLTAALGPQDFIDTCREALGYLSRPQRLALGELLQARARYADLNTPGLMKQGLQDPTEIAIALEKLHREDPALVAQLLGSEFRDLPVMKLTLGALAVSAARRRVRPPDQG
jgi:hypothetical protein